MKYLPFLLVLLLASCSRETEALDLDSKEEETEYPALLSFVGDHLQLIVREEFKTMGGGSKDTISEIITISQINDSLYNYKIANTGVNHDIIRKTENIENNYYESKYCSSFLHYA